MANEDDQGLISDSPLFELVNHLSDTPVNIFSFPIDLLILDAHFRVGAEKVFLVFIRHITRILFERAVGDLGGR